MHQPDCRVDFNFILLYDFLHPSSRKTKTEKKKKCWTLTSQNDGDPARDERLVEASPPFRLLRRAIQLQRFLRRKHTVSPGLSQTNGKQKKTWDVLVTKQRERRSAAKNKVEIKHEIRRKGYYLQQQRQSRFTRQQANITVLAAAR